MVRVGSRVHVSYMYIFMYLQREKRERSKGGVVGESASHVGHGIPNPFPQKGRCREKPIPPRERMSLSARLNHLPGI